MIELKILSYVVISIVAIMILSIGCVSNSENQNTSIQQTFSVTPVLTPIPIEIPTPVPTSQYVTCSDYHKIIDKWKTPDGTYVKLDNNFTVELMPIEYIPDPDNPIQLGDDYTNITLGEYTTICDYGGCTSKVHTVKLMPVTEAKSGYRDACEVIS